MKLRKMHVCVKVLACKISLEERFSHSGWPSKDEPAACSLTEGAREHGFVCVVAKGNVYEYLRGFFKIKFGDIQEA